MSHMVIYRTGDGQPGYHQAEELDEAVKFVERLRNVDGVDSARIFHMEEINFDFRPYFKVEIGPSGEPIQTPKAEATPAPEPVPLADAPSSVPTAPSGDAWGDLGSEPEGEPTPLVEQAASFMPETEAGDPLPVEGNGKDGQAEEGVTARRGIFGR